MLKAYVGLASPQGLEALTPDHHQVVCAFAARAKKGRSVCCWAVLSDDSAELIGERLAAGDTRSALALLESTARDVGPILPSDLTGG